MEDSKNLKLDYTI